MPTTRELSVAYGSVTLGGSTDRQIDKWVLHEEDYESGYFECEFVTSATTEAAFVTEVNAIRDEFRTPRLDLVVTLGSTTLLSRRHSTNTALDTDPVMVKDGDPADTGRSRHFRVRINYGLPANNVSTSFRRWSTVAVEYTAERQRIVTVTGAYTANSTDGTTAAFTQYRDQITAYLSTVTSGIDSTATWETVGEPQVERNETNKVCTFTIVAKELLHNQRTGTLDDLDIIDPDMEIFRERVAPGDSVAGGFSFAGIVFASAPATGGITRPTLTLGAPVGGGQASVNRPTRITITYRCGINKERTKDRLTKWTSVIRPFLISEARRVAQSGVCLIREDPGFIDYTNRLAATMEFLSYASRAVIEQKITVKDATTFGRRLVATTTRDPYDYYDYPGPAVRTRHVVIEYRQVVTGEPKPEAVLKSLEVELAATVTGDTGIAGPEKWVPISNQPGVAVVRQGLVGANIEDIAEVQIERLAQRRNKKTPSLANAGGVTGSNLTL